MLHENIVMRFKKSDYWLEVQQASQLQESLKAFIVCAKALLEVGQ